MTVYFVRHGQTDYNAQGRSQGWMETPINAVGAEQARVVAGKIAKLEIKHLYCSSTKRARQTADIINKQLGLPITYDDRLREKNSGDVAGMVKRDLPYLEDYRNNPHKYNAESWEDVYLRVRNFLDELKSGGHDNSLVVSHGGTIRMVQYCLCERLWDKNRFHTSKALDNAEILKIKIK